MPIRRMAPNGALAAFDLREAIERRETCDIFISHKKDDEELALAVFRCVQYRGLVPWIDVLDDSIDGDGPELDAKIQDIITNSFSLLAVVSEATHQSWWVPFEIGIAFDQQRILASYVEQFRGTLPTFLEKHPKVRNHANLHQWCDRLRVVKTAMMASPRGVYLAEDMTQPDRWSRAWTSTGMSYVNEMRNLARSFG